MRKIDGRKEGRQEGGPANGSLGWLFVHGLLQSDDLRLGSQRASRHALGVDPQKVSQFESQIDIPHAFELVHRAALVVNHLTKTPKSRFKAVGKFGNPRLRDAASTAILDRPDIMAVAFRQQLEGSQSVHREYGTGEKWTNQTKPRQALAEQREVLRMYQLEREAVAQLVEQRTFNP